MLWDKNKASGEKHLLSDTTVIKITDISINEGTIPLSLHTVFGKTVRLSRCCSINFLSNLEHLCSATDPFAQTDCCWFPAKPQNQSDLRQHGPQIVNRPKVSVQVLNHSVTFYFMCKTKKQSWPKQKQESPHKVKKKNIYKIMPSVNA